MKLQLLELEETRMNTYESSKIYEQECEKYQKEVERVFSLVFLDPSSPKLASGSPEPPNSFMVKKPTRLGELQLVLTSSLLQH